MGKTQNKRNIDRSLPSQKSKNGRQTAAFWKMLLTHAPWNLLALVLIIGILGFVIMFLAGSESKVAALLSTLGGIFDKDWWTIIPGVIAAFSTGGTIYLKYDNSQLKKRLNEKDEIVDLLKEQIGVLQRNHVQP